MGPGTIEEVDLAEKLAEEVSCGLNRRTAGSIKTSTAGHNTTPLEYLAPEQGKVSRSRETCWLFLPSDNVVMLRVRF